MSATFDPAVLRKLDTKQAAFLMWQAKWAATARPSQIPPASFTECGYMAGRGFGKTRVGAEWLAREAYLDAAGNPCAVIAPTYQDVKFVCFEGESGLLSVIPQELLADYNKGDMVVKLHNCAGGVTEIRGFTAEKPERLRGPQHARIWCFIAGTMVSTPEGDRPIETLQVGDTVLTRKGPRRVLANSVRGPIAVGEVSFSTGAKLVGTPDHTVYTASGWTRLDQLTKEHELCAISVLSGAASGGTATAAATTSGQTSPSARSGRGASTERSGSPKSETYPRGTTSITSTTTKATTASRTSSASRLVITPASTAHWPTRPSATGRLSSLCRWLVSTAARWCSGSAHYPPFAARLASTAKQSDGDPSRATASTAAPSSSPAPETSAASVASTWRPTGRQYVYCLQVEGEPEYFANGILVHNCDELAAWQYDETWDMAMFGLRLGTDPRILWTTTPKPRSLVRQLIAPKPNRVIVTGSTYDNKNNLPQSFYDNLVQYEGTTLGRQELAGELIDPEESGIIKRSWMNLWPADKPLPHFDWIVMSLDTAYTEKSLDKKGDPDPTACGVFGVFHHAGMSHIMLLDCWDEHLGLPDLMRKVKRELQVAYGDDADQALIKPLFGSDKLRTSGRKPDILLIEDKGSGISLRQMLAEAGIEAYAYNPGRADKLSRLHIVSPVFAQKRVWLPESQKHKGRPRTWCEPLLAQLCAFTGPGSVKHDDYVDVCSQALRLCLDKGLVSLIKPKPKMGGDRPPPKEIKNPYAQ